MIKLTLRTLKDQLVDLTCIGFILIPDKWRSKKHSSTKVEYTVVSSEISNSRITYVKGTPNVLYKLFNEFLKASDHLVQSFSPFKALDEASLLMVSL